MNNIIIVSLNIEQDRHLDKVINLCKLQKPDVIVLQEVFERDLLLLESEFNMQSVYTGLNYLQCDSGLQKVGIATFSRLPIITNKILYYSGCADNLPLITNSEPGSMARAILITEIKQGAKKYFIINIHFTWSPNGTPNNQQYRDLKLLLLVLAEIPDFIICGDFNSPRGTDIFDAISAIYTDNIPADVTTTIDRNLHKAGDLNLVVDGMFTTSKYKAYDVAIIDNVSDHCAILSKITLY